MAKQAKRYVITCSKGYYESRKYVSRPLTIAEAVEYYGYTLEKGASWQHEKGNKKINRNPSTIKSLLTNLNNAVNNAAANGYAGEYYTAVEFVGELDTAAV
jgi:hypothetical protein